MVFAPLPIRSILVVTVCMIGTSAAMAQDDGSAVRERISGPVEASVLDVRDGDTIEVEAHVWPRHTVRVAVRVRGIDTPELRGDCEREKRLAEKAKHRMETLVGDRPVSLTEIGGGSFYGRVIGRVADATGRDIGRTLIEEGLAVAYERRGSHDWCAKGSPPRLSETAPPAPIDGLTALDEPDRPSG